MSNSRIETLEARVVSLEKLTGDLQERLLKLQGANDVLGKRILDEIRKSQHREALVTA